MIRWASCRLPAPPALLRAAAIILLAALPIAAQEPDPLLRLDQMSRFAIDAAIDSANALGLPGDVLRSKALEGVRKKAETRKVVEAVRRLFSQLQVARTALGPVDDQELSAAAALLEAGGKPDQLKAFRARQKGRSDLRAFTVWADLISRGVPGEDVSVAITKLWQEGADDVTFQRLWNDVQADISQGLNPGAALLNRVREGPGRVPPKTAPEG